MIPSNLKGLSSFTTDVCCVIDGQSMALPKRAYLVFDTFIDSPESFLNSSMMFRTALICVVGFVYFMNILMSSAYASSSFVVPFFDVQGVMFVELLSLSNSISTQSMKR